MKKCTEKNKGYSYYCFDEELSEELESLIVLIEAYNEGGEHPHDCKLSPSDRGLNEDCLVVEPVETKRTNIFGKDFNASINSAFEINNWKISTIYSGRNRLVRARKGKYDLVIKCFAIPNKVRQIYYGWGRNSKAKRSFQNSLYLEELEIGVAKARAFVEEHSPLGLLKRSYYISDWVDYSKNNIHSEMRGYSNPNGFLPALAQFIVRLHEMGIEHRDLSPGNVLYKYDSLSKTYNFSLVDVNRMKTYPFALSPQLSLRNMERLASNYSVSSQLAYYYAEARGWDIAQTIKQLNNICDAFWLKRMPKLTIRALRRDKGLSTLQTMMLYRKYKHLRTRRKLTSNKELKAKLFAQEEGLYRQFFAIEDIRHSLRKKEHYSYQINQSSRR